MANNKHICKFCNKNEKLVEKYFNVSRSFPKYHTLQMQNHHRNNLRTKVSTIYTTDSITW